MDTKSIKETTAEIMKDYPCRECGGKKINPYATGSKLCHGCGGTGKDRDLRRRRPMAAALSIRTLSRGYCWEF